MRTVVVTNFALNQIESIFDYYSYRVSIKIAEKIKSELLSAIKTLKEGKIEWPEDEYLKYLHKNHKRLICGNYKIIYYYNQVENIVYVTDVFDSRQNPLKAKG
jgi:plasmid stabilization system protein ParE